ncbi:MAG: hypothetical protein HOM01_04465, partial [Kordiimonadaceae bacterium]|nr:hypothetical protein [Kordiimonadaceae bacterium]
KKVNSDISTTSFITKLTDLDDLDATKEFHNSIYSKDSEELLLPVKTASTLVENPLLKAAETTTEAIATDSKGNVYTVGTTDGRFANHLNGSEDGDAFLNKYDATGKLLWSRLVGSQGEGHAFALTVDNNDNIIIAGQADKLSSDVSSNPLATNNNIFNGLDSFVVKYDNVGTQQWIYLNDEYGTDAALSVTTDSNGDVYVTGKQNSIEITSTTTVGNDNAYVLKLDGTDGIQADYVEIGSSNYDFGQAIAVAADGNIIVATHENDHLILQKLDATDLTNELWSHDYGDLGSSSKINNVTVDGNRIYVSGSSKNSLVGGGSEIDPPKGELDGFILAIDDAGVSATADWTKFVGSAQTDKNGGIIVSGGKVYFAGSTSGDVDGNTLKATTDTYAMKIDATTGITDWTKSLGNSTENRDTNGIAFATSGTSVLTKLGLPIGEFEDDEKRIVQTQTTARAGDYFYVKVNNFTTKKIEIKDGDTFRTLANRINRASFRYIKASVTFNSGSSKSVEEEEDKTFDLKAIMDEKLKQIRDERNGVITKETFEAANRDVFGNSLKITSLDGGRIEIIAGRGEKDALKKIGLEPTLILSSKELFDLDKDNDSSNAKDEIGGIFSFKLDDRFSVLNQRDARYVSQQLDYSIGVLQSAYRSLTFDPLAAQLKKDALKGGQGGRVPPHLLKQISNYQDGLNRISALVPQGGVIT